MRKERKQFSFNLKNKKLINVYQIEWGSSPTSTLHMEGLNTSTFKHSIWHLMVKWFQDLVVMVWNHACSDYITSRQVTGSKKEEEQIVTMCRPCITLAIDRILLRTWCWSTLVLSTPPIFVYNTFCHWTFSSVGWNRKQTIICKWPSKYLRDFGLILFFNY